MKNLCQYLEAAHLMQCCIVLKYESGGEQRGFVSSVQPEDETAHLSHHRAGTRTRPVALEGVTALGLAGTNLDVWAKA